MSGSGSNGVMDTDDGVSHHHDEDKGKAPAAAAAAAADGNDDAAAAAADKDEDADDFGRVYRAVAAGETAEEVRRVIEACALGSDERRAAAADTAGWHDDDDDDGGEHYCDSYKEGGDEDDAGKEERKGRKPETPLQAAHRLERGDLVGALLEAGADAKKMFDNPRTNALAVCIAYRQVDSVRALLRSGKHDVNERLEYSEGRCGLDGAWFDDHCTAAHLCIRPPPSFAAAPFDYQGRTQPLLACLKVLVREFGADIEARDQWGRTPLFWADDDDEALELLLRLGANANATDAFGCTKLFGCDRWPNGVWTLLEHGASADVIAKYGDTPLMAVIRGRGGGEPDVILELLHRSSVEVRRSVRSDGLMTYSAIDYILQYDECDFCGDDPSFEDWEKEAVTTLLASGTPVQPAWADCVLPLAQAILADPEEQQLQQERLAKIAAWRSGRFTWRAHDAMVDLALDAQEAREAVREVAAARARVERLEAQLRASASSAGDAESDEDGSESDEAGGESDEAGGEGSSEGGKGGSEGGKGGSEGDR